MSLTVQRLPSASVSTGTQQPDPPIYGLRNWAKDAGCEPKRLEKAYDQYEPGDPVEAMSLVVVAPKTRGAEPGFIARKAWKASDERKLNDPQHRYWATARDYRQQHPDASLEQIREHIQATEPKFRKRHFVKMLYKEPNAFGRVRASRNIGTVRWWLYTETPREKNRQAMMEALGNDIYTALGVHCAKLKVFPSRYRHGPGYPMLVLDGTEIQGRPGSSFNTLRIKPEAADGIIVDGAIPDRRIHGREVPELGRLKAIFYWLADFDAVGQRGDNLAYVMEPESKDVVLYHLDGRPLPPKTSVWDGGGIGGATDLMKHMAMDRDVQITSHPHRTPKDVLMRYYHFSLFDDTTLKERMEGVRLVADPAVRATVAKIFDRYRETYAEGDLDFREELSETQRRLLERGDAIADTFRTRLALSDEQIDFIDNLEKIVSPTRDTSKRGKVKLQHLVKERPIEATLVQTPPTRSGRRGAVVTFEPRGQDSARLVRVLQRFYHKHLRVQLSPGSLRVEPDSGKAVLSLRPHELEEVMRLTTEDAVKQFKSAGLQQQRLLGCCCGSAGVGNFCTGVPRSAAGTGPSAAVSPPARGDRPQDRNPRSL